MPWKEILSIAVALCAIFGLQSPSMAAILRVPSEYSTIQEAINASVDGDTVLVADGIYVAEDSFSLFIRKSITVRGEHGPQTCIINCRGRQEYGVVAVSFNGGPEAISTLDGFTITNANYGAIYTYPNTRVRIVNCIITGNGAAGYGAGIVGGSAELLVENCVITGNVTRDDRDQMGEVSERGRGGGIVCGGDGVTVVRNSLVAGNTATLGGGIACTGQLRLENSILVDNRALSGCGHQAYLGHGESSAPITGWDATELLLSYCCLEEDDPNDFHVAAEPGTELELRFIACISDSPQFVVPGYWGHNGTADDPRDDFWGDGDYHLKSQAGRWDPASQSWVQDDVTSPCIDTGNPNTPIMYEPFPNGGIVNMGAYGGTTEASKSYFDQPVCETIIAGDINGDCKVDMKDLILLINHWTDE